MHKKNRWISTNCNISSLFIKNREEHLVYIKITAIYDYTNNKDLYKY